MESWEIINVTKFEVVSDFVLRVYFDDNTAQVINFLPALGGELMGPLRDIKLFSQVHLNSEIGTLVWPGNRDFNPAILHDWPELAAGLEQQAKQWEKARLSFQKKPSQKAKPRARTKLQKPKTLIRNKS